MRKYNSGFEIINNKKFCYYCGEIMQIYEDRQGCDYRESGEYYTYCTCSQSYAEEEYFKEKRCIEFEMKKLLTDKII